MPRPIYMICSDSGAVDRQTGRVSHFNVVDMFTITIDESVQPASEAQVAAAIETSILNIQVVAAWGLDEHEDSKQEYEIQFASHRPGEDRETASEVMPFSLEKSLNRMVVNVGIGGNPKTISGFWRFESRIRPKGTEAWQAQTYLIRTEVTRINSKTAETPAT